MNKIKNVCVFASSSNSLDKEFYEDARQLGILLAQEGFNLVYGGAKLGSMFETARAVKEFGGNVIGVIPEKLHELYAQNTSCDELHVTKCMRTRKEKLDEVSDAVVALAGGFGTLEELSEMIVQKQLAYNNKAIVIINTNGFYDSLLKFFDEIINSHFAIEESRNFYYVAKTPKEAVDYLKNHIPEENTFCEKIAFKAATTVRKT